MHQGYGTLAGGVEAEVFADLTGAVPLLQDMQHPSMRTAVSDGTLRQNIWRHVGEGGLLGCTAVDRAKLSSSETAREEDEDIIRATVSLGDKEAHLHFRIDQDATEVAENFMRKNEIPPANLSTIVSFVEHHQSGAKKHRDENLAAVKSGTNVRSRREDLTESLVPDHAYAVVGVEGEGPGKMYLEVWNPCLTLTLTLTLIGCIWRSGTHGARVFHGISHPPID